MVLGGIITVAVAAVLVLDQGPLSMTDITGLVAEFDVMMMSVLGTVARAETATVAVNEHQVQSVSRASHPPLSLQRMNVIEGPSLYSSLRPG